jgi:vacuolar-type H+-ATPase subunit F/Vma7
VTVPPAYRLLVVARPDLAAGFALAGCAALEAETAEAGARAVAESAAAPDVGLLVAEEDFVAALPAPVARDLARRPVPLVVTLARPPWTAPAVPPEEPILAVLQRAIGYRVRLR